MTTILVALWSRNTKEKHNVNAEVLQYVRQAVARTKEKAVAQGLRPAQGALTSIFIAPEFLFTRPAAHRRVVDSTAISMGMRDWILESVEKTARTCTGMLLIPGTIVFKEELTLATIAKATKMLEFAQAPLAPSTRSDGKLRTLKPYITWEARGDAYGHLSESEGTVAVYKDQIHELSQAEKNLVLRLPVMVERSFLIKNRTYVFFDGSKIFSFGKKINANDYFSDGAKGIFVPGKKTGITTVAGINIGFEICADHGQGILHSYLPRPSLDLQVICSAEIPNETSRFRIRKGGYVLHASSDPQHSAVYQDKERIDAIATDEVGGAPLSFYMIELDPVASAPVKH